MTIAITEYGRIREFASCGAVIIRKVGEYFFLSNKLRDATH